MPTPKVEILPPESEKRPSRRSRVTAVRAGPAVTALQLAPRNKPKRRQCLLCSEHGEWQTEVEAGPVRSSVCDECSDMAWQAKMTMDFILKLFRRGR